MLRMDLTAQNREKGKGKCRRLRNSGFVPAVLYGADTTPKNLFVNAREIEALEKKAEGFNFLIDLKVEGGEDTLAMVRDYQADPIKRFLTHLDLQKIDINKKLEVEVPVILTGIPIGVKDEGGVIDQSRRSLHIRALPTNIPAHIEIDVSAMSIGDNVHANQVALPEGVEFPHDTNFTIVTIVPPTKIEAAVVAVPVEGEEGAVVEGVEGAAPAEGEEPKTDVKADATKAKGKKE
ncbi:MAG: 50S ribosomal protein L25 [Pseudomonadota bacterium]